MQSSEYHFWSHGFMSLKDLWESCYSQGSSTLIVSLELLHVVACTLLLPELKQEKIILEQL